jgi:hypothetical protein
MLRMARSQQKQAKRYAGYGAGVGASARAAAYFEAAQLFGAPKRRAKAKRNPAADFDPYDAAREWARFGDLGVYEQRGRMFLYNHRRHLWTEVDAARVRGLLGITSGKDLISVLVAGRPAENPRKRPQLSDTISRRAAADAATRAMRAAGRRAWSRKDYNRAVREYARLRPLHPNPSRAARGDGLARSRVVGTLPASQIEVRYKRGGKHPGYYRHVFKQGVKIQCLDDGSVRFVGPKRTWSRGK